MPHMIGARNSATCPIRLIPPMVTIPTMITIPIPTTTNGIPNAPFTAVAAVCVCIAGSKKPGPINTAIQNNTARILPSVLFLIPLDI